MKSFQIVNKFELNADKYLSALLLATPFCFPPHSVNSPKLSIRWKHRFPENNDPWKQQLTETFYPSPVDHERSPEMLAEKNA